MNRQEMARLGGIGLKFTPNSRHVRIHCSGLRVEIITPRGIQDSITSERTVNILKKVQQKVVLGRSYFHFFATTSYLPAADIDGDVGETKYLVNDKTRSAGENSVTVAGKLVHARRFHLGLDFDYVIHISLRSFFGVVCCDSELGSISPTDKWVSANITSWPAQIFLTNWSQRPAPVGFVSPECSYDVI
jgi:hypothetical protein